MTRQTVIPVSAYFRGELETRSDVLIEGSVEGLVWTTGHVEVARGGRVRSSQPLRARSLRISGEVRCDVEVEEEVFLEPEGRLRGEVLEGRLVVAEGARYAERRSEVRLRRPQASRHAGPAEEMQSPEGEPARSPEKDAWRGPLEELGFLTETTAPATPRADTSPPLQRAPSNRETRPLPPPTEGGRRAPRRPGIREPRLPPVGASPNTGEWHVASSPNLPILDSLSSLSVIPTGTEDELDFSTPAGSLSPLPPWEEAGSTPAVSPPPRPPRGAAPRSHEPVPYAAPPAGASAPEAAPGQGGSHRPQGRGWGQKDRT